MLLLLQHMTEEKEAPFYGPTEEWYQTLVQFSFNYLEGIRLKHAGVAENARRKTVENACKKPEYSILPADMIDVLETRQTPVEIFAFLTARVTPELADGFAAGKLAHVIEAASRFGQDMQPLILMALVHSIHETVPSLTWMGARIGSVFTEYIQALEDIYKAQTGIWIFAEHLKMAKLHRDEIEYFCFELFGHELQQIRTYLARLAPDRFLYQWEELDDKHNIVMKKSLAKDSPIK